MDIRQIKHTLRDHEMENISEARVVQAAVLVPLVERDGVPHILFEERNSTIPQGGEICFPGGHVEDGEAPEDAALRETSEELLVDPRQIELVAPLHCLRANGAREIRSFLGVLRDYAGTWEADEVARTFLLPVEWLRQRPPEIYEGRIVNALGDDFPYELIPGGRDYPFASGVHRFYFYRTEYGVIWGLTAQLLYHFLKLL